MPAYAREDARGMGVFSTIEALGGVGRDTETGHGSGG